ncbi:hypothetical protein ACFOG5_20660 [Pedobacter fastidiosus]|uniref:Uncharacterized protein n=1 Tax=Pedobacter fastidiosus TaxID=2765361 RepID=A0ABR7KU17_9SPHI|nr:hypothetical protein [Pedobacter fastidiosus]MBC6111596.1 hypothetical protein [Pedobacter fastidiosus]
MAQNQDIAQMDSLRRLIIKNYKRLDTIFQDCELHYTMIKMEIDKNNKVTSITSLNAISDDFLNFFKPLEKIKFQKEKMAKKTVLFTYVYYPKRACAEDSGELYDEDNYHYFLSTFSSLLVKQIKLNPKTVYYEYISSNLPQYFERRNLRKKK